LPLQYYLGARGKKNGISARKFLVVERSSYFLNAVVRAMCFHLCVCVRGSSMSQPSILSFFKKPGTAVATAKSAPSRKRPRSTNTVPSSSQDDVVPVEEQREHVAIDCDEQIIDHQAAQSPKQLYADCETKESAEQAHSAESSDDDADATLTDDDTAELNHLSAFELQRLANIKRNNAFLSSLGLQAAKPTPLLPAAASRKRKASSTAKRTAAGSSSSSISSLPARRSSRLTGEEAVCYNEDALRVIDDTTASKQVRLLLLNSIHYRRHQSVPLEVFSI
jgi:hypothetical protein